MASRFPQTSANIASVQALRELARADSTLLDARICPPARQDHVEAGEQGEPDRQLGADAALSHPRRGRKMEIFAKDRPRLEEGERGEQGRSPRPENCATIALAAISAHKSSHARTRGSIVISANRGAAE